MLLTRHILTLILAASLMLGSGFGGYKRTAHAIARAGVTQIVICSTDGAETVQIDRNGNAVAPASTRDCAHCADCSLVPLASFSAPSDMSVPTARDVSVSLALISLPARADRVEYPSRGPPSQSKV